MVFNFSNSHKFLADYIKKLPKSGFGEAKKIAHYLGVSSTYISHVLRGSKTITLEQATQLSKYLGLGPIEEEYFFYLVQLERAGNQELKKFCEEKLGKIKTKSLKLADRIEGKKVLTELQKSVFYSAPVYSMVHIFCATHKSGRSIDEISKRFNISRAKASEIMRFLVEANLCIEQNDKYLIETQMTHLEEGSPFLLKHHTNWRLKATQAAENLDPTELMYTLNIAVSEKDFENLREEVVLFIKKFLEKASPSPSETIATLNMDWFKIRN